MSKEKRGYSPMWFLRLKIIFFCVIGINMFMSWKTKCFAEGARACVNPEYIGQNYLWSAGGVVIAMLIMFVYDCWTLESNDESEGI
ncbi:TMhelix containing protein [Vibrio phage 2.275.O._10N.286.54.E11]|nr:TMhelix containing protein [Vibrio phage 2.275.O._10N.286.54.E11]